MHTRVRLGILIILLTAGTLLIAQNSILPPQPEAGDPEAELQQLLNSQSPTTNQPLTTQNQTQSYIGTLQPGNQNPNGVLTDRASIPNIFVAGDLVADFDAPGTSKENRQRTNTMDIREVEFGFSGAVDQNMLATALFALHRETHGINEGKYIFDIHEFFIDLNQLPWNLRVRAGKMFLDAGRLNQIHRHDWHFTNAPMVHREIFNDTQIGEGAADTGIETSYLVPWKNYYQEIKFGVYRGRVFGHNHGDGPEKPNPLYLARLKQFQPIIGQLGLLYGASYIRYNPDRDPGNVDHTGGADFTFRWQRNRWEQFLWSTEVWNKTEVRPALSANNTSFGWYSFVEYTRNRIDYGFRVEYFRRDSVLFGTSDFYGQAAWVAYRPSEFSLFRGTVERQSSNGYEQRFGDSYQVYLQTVFMLGFHPAHTY